MRVIKIMKEMIHSSKQLKIPSEINFSTDVYKSIHLKVNQPIQENNFQKYLEELLNCEEKYNSETHPDNQTRAVWVYFVTENMHLLPLLSKLAFKIHHAVDKQLVMYKWISSRSDLATPYSMFYISCGAAVIKDDKIFLVQERGGNRKGKYGLPGGRADFGETLKTCSERELWEETGIKAKYHSILYFREMTNTVFGGVDIYFVCMMKLDDQSLDSINICERELTDGKWVPLADYLSFAQENSFGTQLEVAQYIHNLQEKGYNFHERIPNETLSYDYISPRDKVTRQFIQHLMVEGSEIK